MKDLETIRKNLSAKVQEFDGTQTSIPDYLKRALIKAWQRAESIRPGYFVLKLQKGKGSEDLTDTNLIKCIYARELLEELLKYRNGLQKFLEKNSINQSTAEDLCAKTNKNNTNNQNINKINNNLLIIDSKETKKTELTN